MKLKEKEYVLSDGRSGESCMIKTGKKGNLTIFDPETKRRRAIRHCPNQRSIYIDEQDEFALVEPIIFKFGTLTVGPEWPITQEFLDKHPSNVNNGGTWFQELDEEKEAKADIQLDELRMDVKSEVRKTAKQKDGIHELSAVVAVLEGSVDKAMSMDIESLKRAIYNRVDEDVYYFLDDNLNVNIFENDEIKRKYITLRAIKDGIIAKSPNNRSMVWAKDKKVIATAPASIDLTDHFVNFLSTDEGMLVLDEIMKRS